MRWFTLLCCLPVLAWGQENTSLDDAVVQLSYKELRNLIEAARPQASPTPVVDHALLSAAYTLDLKTEAATGRASFEVQTFREGPHAIPLASDSLALDAVEPKDATVVLKDGRYTLILEGKQRTRVELRFSLPAKRSGEGSTYEAPLCQAVSTSLDIQGIPTGRQPIVTGALPRSNKQDSRWQLGAATQLRVALRDEAGDLPPPITMPAVIAEAKSSMRVVNDGAYFNKISWRIRHTAPLVWKLALPETEQLVTSHVDGMPVSPSRIDPSTLEFRLPESSDGEGTLVEISYTGKGSELEPVRGELALALPSTSLLVEQILWKVTLPPAFESVAAQGNVDFSPASSNNELQLTKELCQGEAPGVRIFYQKPENRKQP